MTDRVNVLLHRTVVVDSDLRPGAPLTYFNDGGEGGGGSKDFFGSDILAKKDFFWVYERRRDFFGWRKQQRDFFWYCIFHQLKSKIT